MYSCSRTVPLTAKKQQTMTTTISNEVLQDIWIPHHDILDEHEEDDEVLQDIRIPHHDITDEHEEDDDDDNELHSSPTGDTVCWSKSRYSKYDRQTPCVPKDMVKSGDRGKWFIAKPSTDGTCGGPCGWDGWEDQCSSMKFIYECQRDCPPFGQ